MNDILKGYSQEEIETLAIMQLESNEFKENISLKIEKIDKEYKEHNKQAIKKVIKNGSIILLCAGTVLSSNSNISNFGTEDLLNLFDKLIEFASYLPKSDILVAIYSKMFDGINYIVDSIGLMGIFLATKSIKLVLSITKDTKQSLKIKKELLDLKRLIEQKENTNERTK